MSEIPQFRLPYDVVNFEAKLMKDLGVKVIKNISCLCIAQRKKKKGTRTLPKINSKMSCTLVKND